MPVDYIALSVPFFLVLMGLELLVASARGREVYRFADAVTDLGCGIGQQVLLAFFKTALMVGYAWTYERFTLVRFPEGSWAPWVIAFFGVEIGYYGWHRLSHEVAILWAVHGVHHQSEDYNLAVALRQAWFSAITSWPFYLPMALLGVPPVINLTMQALSTLYQFWIHTRLIDRLGWLEGWLNTPSHHRVHHGRNPKYLDRNHGATLIVWDRIFGTFQREEEEPLYGTVKVHPSFNPAWANVDLLVDLWRNSRRAPTLGDALRVWWKPPGWVPGGAAVAPPEPDPAHPVRYDVELSIGLKSYIMVNFFLCVAATTYYMLHQGSMSWGTLAIGGSAIFATTVAWGGLMEGRRWAIPLEVARLAGLALPLLA